ncbi:hypothetical protein V1509DRAFT_634764 [Lipomyces kononenkoae]
MGLEFYLFCILGGAAIGWGLYVLMYGSDTRLIGSSWLVIPLSTDSCRRADCYCESAIKRAAYNTSLYYKISRDIQLVLVRFGISHGLSSSSTSSDGSAWRVASLIAVGVCEATKCLVHDGCTAAYQLVKSVSLSLTPGGNPTTTSTIPSLPVPFDRECMTGRWVASPIIAVMIWTILIPFRYLKLAFVRGAQQFCEFLELLDGESAIMPTYHHHHSSSQIPTQSYRKDSFRYTGRHMPPSSSSSSLVEESHSFRRGHRDYVFASSVQPQSGFSHY